jgi:hypothetical protein
LPDDTNARQAVQSEAAAVMKRMKTLDIALTVICQKTVSGFDATSVSLQEKSSDIFATVSLKFCKEI